MYCWCSVVVIVGWLLLKNVDFVSIWMLMLVAVEFVFASCALSSGCSLFALRSKFFFSFSRGGRRISHFSQEKRREIRVSAKHWLLTENGWSFVNSSVEYSPDPWMPADASALDR